MAVSQRFRIQEALEARAKAHHSPRVVYGASGPELTGEAAVPSTALANEISSEFEAAAMNRRRVLQDRGAWEYSLRLEWPFEVLLEGFEEGLMGDPIRVPAANGFRAVIVEMSGVEYEHPPRNQSPKGTKAVYRFVAREGPR